MCVCVLGHFSHVQLSVTPWTPASQAPVHGTLQARILELGGGIGMGNTCKSMADIVSVWQKPLQYCKVISLQLIKVNGKKKKNARVGCHFLLQ